jgi:hypothetical protein
MAARKIQQNSYRRQIPQTWEILLISADRQILRILQILPLGIEKNFGGQASGRRRGGP